MYLDGSTRISATKTGSGFFGITRSNMDKIALDKKLEWERIYEGLKDILDILTGMNEKPMMQSELVRMIQTAKVQAKLWTNPPVKTLASEENKMADLKKRAEQIIER